MAQTQPRSRPKQERLDARLTADQKALIQKAADLEGRSLSDFVVASAFAAAEERVRRHEVMVLSERDSRLLVELLSNPPPPNERLRELARRNRDLLGG